MRKRSPRHQEELDSLQRAELPEVFRRIKLSDHEQPDYVASEVLATLIRNRANQAGGVVTAAVVELNRRLQVFVGKRVRGVKSRPEVKRRGDQMLGDTIDYVWDRFYEDQDLVSNSEAFFAVFARNKIDDFLEHLCADKNSMDSVDSMDIVDEDGNASSYISTVEDTNAETPEEALMRQQLNAKALNVLMTMPKLERDAFCYRVECKYPWQLDADLLGCSIPTANKHFAAAMEKLEGALE